MEKISGVMNRTYLYWLAGLFGLLMMAEVPLLGSPITLLLPLFSIPLIIACVNIGWTPAPPRPHLLVLCLFLLPFVSGLWINNAMLQGVFKRLQHSPYISNKVNTEALPLHDILSMVSSVGANSYGGQLMSQEVMQLKYKVPFYIKNGLVAQANYVNSLESAGLINNVPESMDNIDVILPSYKLVEKAEAEQRGSSYVGYDSKSHKRIEAMIQTVNNVTGKDALMTHTLPIADLKKLQTIIKEHYPNKSASGIITRYLGNRKLPNLYDKLNKCYRALGAANKECSHEM